MTLEDRIRQRIERRINEMRKRQNQFITDVQTNPRRAMEYSDSMFRAVAFIDVGDWIVSKLANNSLENVSLYIHRAILSAAEASRSTSPITNFVDDCRREAWVQVWNMIEEERQQ